jgi:hypothetical protein
MIFMAIPPIAHEGNALHSEKVKPADFAVPTLSVAIRQTNAAIPD